MGCDENITCNEINPKAKSYYIFDGTLIFHPVLLDFPLEWLLVSLVMPMLAQNNWVFVWDFLWDLISDCCADRSYIHKYVSNSIMLFLLVWMIKVLEESIETAPNHSLEAQELTGRQLSNANMLHGSSTHFVNSIEAIECNVSAMVSSEASIPAERVINMLLVRTIPEPKLLDERPLLVCIVHAIPTRSGGQIRISSTVRWVHLKL